MDKILEQRLTYFSETSTEHRNKHGKKIPFAIYECTCGNLVEKNKPDVNRGKIKSCGNCNGHYMTGSRFYRIWKAIKTRCLNSNYKEYHYYGGRGIKVCEKWTKFSNFKEDMYESYLYHCSKYGERQTTVERIDVNGNYEPKNCKWATYAEQNANKRN